MATIMEVAKLAGVSMKTVSRVVNNELHVRPVTRERVLAAIAKLDYRPNLAARQLAGNRSYLIALLTSDVQTSYWSQIILAASAECRRFGYHLVTETFPDGEAGHEVIRQVLRHSRPEGIILPAPFCDDHTLVDAIAESGTPLVRLAGSGIGYGTTIPVHEEAIASDLVSHLLALGHTRIAMIAPPAAHLAAAQRVAGYRVALARAGIRYRSTFVVEGDFSFASGARLARTLLSRPRPPTAIFAANDGMALGVLAVARQMNIGVPDQLAIAGFDDSPAGRMVFPALTTVRQPLQALASRAVVTLLGEDPDYGSLNHELIVRGSTSGSRDLVLDTIDA